jgi:hypothetical protein
MVSPRFLSSVRIALTNLLNFIYFLPHPQPFLAGAGGGSGFGFGGGGDGFFGCGLTDGGGGVATVSSTCLPLMKRLMIIINLV